MSASAPSFPPVAPAAPAKPISKPPATGPLRPVATSRVGKWALSFFQSLIVIVAVGAFWQLLVSKGWVERTVLPAPSDVALTFKHSIQPRFIFEVDEPVRKARQDVEQAEKAALKAKETAQAAQEAARTAHDDVPGAQEKARLAAESAQQADQQVQQAREVQGKVPALSFSQRWSMAFDRWKASETPIIEREEKEYQTRHRRADELAAKEAAGQSPQRSLWRRTIDGIDLAWESMWRPLSRLYRGTWLNWFLSGELINDAVGSLGRVLSGFLIGGIPALLLGLTMGASNLMYRLMNPLVQVLRPIPPIAWIPLAILRFGLGNQPARFLIDIGAYFPVLINTIAGVRNVDGIYIRAARNLGVGRMQMFWRVIIPAAMPYILTGVKIGIGVAFIVVIVAEMIAPPDGGLGYRINEAREFFKSDVVVCGMISIGILGLLIDVIISKLNNHLLRWHRGAEQN